MDQEIQALANDLLQQVTGGRTPTNPRVKRRVLESLLLLLTIELRRIGELLANGEISRLDWRMMTDRLVSAGHLAAAELSVEGENDLIAIPLLMDSTNISLNAIEALNTDFAAGIVATTQIAHRTQLFGIAPKRSYSRVAMNALDQLGYTLWISRLGVADHCWECVDEAGKGPRPLNEIIPIGERVCSGRCYCHLEAVNTRSGDIAVI